MGGRVIQRMSASVASVSVAVALVACTSGDSTSSPADAATDTTADAVVASDASVSDASSPDAAGVDAAPLDPLSCINAALTALTTAPIVSSIPQPSCQTMPAICCQGGDAGAMCGKLAWDFGLSNGDSPRLVTNYNSPAKRLDVTLRVRVKTNPGIPVTMGVLGDCGAAFDTTPGATQDLQIDLPISFVDAGDGGASALMGDLAVSKLASEDVSLTGAINCQIANPSLFIASFVSLLTTEATQMLHQFVCTPACGCK